MLGLVLLFVVPFVNLITTLNPEVPVEYVIRITEAADVGVAGAGNILLFPVEHFGLLVEDITVDGVDRTFNGVWYQDDVGADGDFKLDIRLHRPCRFL